MQRTFLAILYVLCLSSGFAQNDSLQIQSVIDKFFTALKTGDTTAMKLTIVPEIQLATTFTARNGNPVLQHESFQEFLESVGTPRKEEWNEHYAITSLNISDNLASVWMDYSFYLNSTFSHCGENSFQLFKSIDGWKIISIVDTRRKENCKITLEK